MNIVGRPSRSSVDGQTGDPAIASVFAKIYRRFYNGVSFDSTAMAGLEFDIDNQIRSSCCSGVCYGPHYVTVLDIQGAVKLLKAGKYDGVMSTDHILNAGSDFLNHFSILCTAMVRHCFVLSSLL